MLSSRLQHQFIEVFTVPPKILFIICDKLFLTPTAALHNPSPPKKKKKKKKKIEQKDHSSNKILYKTQYVLCGG